MRTTGVKLIAETAEYRRDMDGAAKSTDAVKKSIDDVATASDKAGDKIEDLGDDLKDGERGAKELRREIEQAERSLESLAVQFAETSKAADRLDIARAIRKQQSELRQLLKIESLLPSPGESDNVGRSFGGRLFGSISSGLSAAASSAPGAVAGGIMGAALAPSIAAGIGAGISAGVGLGAIVAGVKLVAKDPQVSAAGKEMGERFSRAVSSEAEVFKVPVLKAIGEIDDFLGRTTPKIGRIFGNVAPEVEGLVKHLTGAGDKISDALEGASSRAAEPLRALGLGIENIGGAFGRMIDTLTQRSPEGAAAIDDLANATTHAVDTTTAIVNGVGHVKGWTEAVDDAIDKGRYWVEDHSAISETLSGVGISLDITADGYKKNSEAARLYRQGLIGVNGSANDYNNYIAEAAKKTNALADATTLAQRPQKAFVGTLSAADKAARGELDAMTELSTELRKQADPVFALMKAQDTLKKAQNDVAEATKKHGRESEETRLATRKLAIAALELQGRAGALGGTFNGNLSPAMRATLKAAGLTEQQIKEVERQFKNAKAAGDKFAKNYKAAADLVGNEKVGTELWILNQVQQALKKGTSVPANLVGTLNKGLRGKEGPQGKAAGGRVEGYSPHPAADNIPAMLTADEWVIRQPSARRMEQRHPGALRYINDNGELPGFAAGGAVTWPYPVTAKDTWVPTYDQVVAAVIPKAPGGVTGPWMERLLESRFKVRMISGFRPGSRTLSGNLSYHALNRAVDFPAIKAMAAFMYDHYKPRLKEAITPWQQYNVHNGRSHRYTGAVWNQHNFAGGNAHNHFAMANGGRIGEPVFGVGASGNTYSFGEFGDEFVTNRSPFHLGTGPNGGPQILTNITLNVALAAGANPREAGRQISEQLASYLGGGGSLVVNGQKVLP